MKESMQKIRDNMKELSEGDEVDMDKMKEIERTMMNLQREFILKEEELQELDKNWALREQELIENLEKLND